MYFTIGAFDAKAKLSELLQEVKRGQCYTITLRGVPIADLIPNKSTASLNIEGAIKKMQSIEKIRGVSNELLQELIIEGRR
jgi:prevent-host-death family protein